MRKKEVVEHQEQGGNIYSFNLVFGPAKGEETSQPRLWFTGTKSSRTMSR